MNNEHHELHRAHDAPHLVAVHVNPQCVGVTGVIEQQQGGEQSCAKVCCVGSCDARQRIV